jgi:hypothetical protein
VTMLKPKNESPVSRGTSAQNQRIARAKTVATATVNDIRMAARIDLLRNNKTECLKGRFWN